MTGLLSSRCTERAHQHYPIVMHNDLARAHAMFEAAAAGEQQTRRAEVLIVGGGLAGLAAAHGLRDRDWLLCELGPRLGGSAGFASDGGLSFAQGAHYELEQPGWYGQEVTALLEQLGILQFNGLRNMWEYADQQFLIEPSRESRAWVLGRVGETVLPPTAETQTFINLLAPFEKRMPQPLRLLEPDLKPLAEISFAQYLRDAGLPLLPSFLRGLDYHMKDDYGAGAEAVSALAGIHYYRCRPYYVDMVRVFSPPEGNGYFVTKLAGGLPADRLLTHHLVRRIETTADGFRVQVARDEGLLNLQVKQLVYAGHKHGLKYVMPAAAGAFEHIRYAPWVVMNLIIDGRSFGDVYWQNDVIGSDQRSLGFVNSMAQAEETRNRHVLTAYYCLPLEQREIMAEMDGDSIRPMVDATITAIETALDRPLRSRVEKVHVKLHGHGMPIPEPGYLFRDGNLNRPNPGMVFAGVDNGRLPLIFEALDSGLTAASLLKN